MATDPPHLSPGTEVSAKYKGAFCEAKIKKCQKTVKCKVSPKDGGPQISVADDAIQGHLKIGGLVKVRQPDSGQLIDGIITRIIDSSIYTVVFDDGDVATLKRTQICLKGEKHYMEGDTLDKLPLTNPEHFSTPVNPLKKERRRRSGALGHNSSATMSDDSDIDETASLSRRISPRGNSRQALDTIGKVVSVCEKKRWVPALVIRPSNHEADMKNKGLIMVKSFRDGKIYTVTEKQLRDFSRESIRSYADDKLTKTALERAYKYTSSKELPVSWKREEILGSGEQIKKVAVQAVSVTPPPSASSPIPDNSFDEDSSSSEEEETNDRFIAQLYKFMDDRSTPINKPAQLYNRDVSLSKLYLRIGRYGGFSKVCAIGKWRDVAKRLGFAGISAGTEMKLLYRRYLLPFEEFHRKIGETHMFEGSRVQKSTSSVGRNVLPPRDRESQLVASGSVKTSSTKPLKEASAPSIEKNAPSPQSSPEQKPRSDTNLRTDTEDTSRRTPLRQACKKEEKRTVENPKKVETPVAGSRTRPTSTKLNMKVEKAVKLSMDDGDIDEEVASATYTDTSTIFSGTMVKPCGSQVKEILVKPKDEPVDFKTDNDSVVSEDETSSSGVKVSVEVDYPPGTKLKVRYGRARNVKIYDAKVVEVKLGEDRQLLYSVHYNGWNTRYDEVITNDRIVGTTGKCEKKKMDISRVKPGRYKKQKSVSQVTTSASSTGSRTPEPPAPKSSSCQKVPPRIYSYSKTGKTVPTPVTSRTTRSSTTDEVTLAKHTRSQSVDSSVSNVSTRKRRRSVLADGSTKRPHIDNGESTDEDCKESITDELDTEKPESQAQVSEKAFTDSFADKSPPEIPASTSKTPKRLVRGGNKSSIATASLDADSPNVVEDAKTCADSTLVTDTLPQVTDTLTQTTAGSTIEDTVNKIHDVIINQVVEGDVPTADDVEECSPSKLAKVEKSDSANSITCDEAFVKIETLSQDPAIQSQSSEQSDEQSEKDSRELELPPLLASTGITPSADSESKTSAVSSLADDSETSLGSDFESKSMNQMATATVSQQVLHSATSNLSLLSEQASLTQLEPGLSRAKQRSSTRRQQLAAKRSPRPKYPDLELDTMEPSPSNDEISNITTSTQRTSPTKPPKSAAHRPPRQPKYNFRIEEELAEIKDQDERIEYLVNKMAEIRSFYSEVKSNLSSIERKKRRVRQVREPLLHHSQD
ncbi:AT-rich interactive domain-containing protein 4B-like isoform X2 [Watersipora subatra]|uniref:AT-rich interactive domain-containing protein 4B-like isoform X2 n=1 Tax=Watersipora subatra TaxID=2589382 RepID=UPI00355C121C